MSYGYEDAIARRVASSQPSFAGGSGYFAPRSAGLDPALFEGTRVRQDVRHLVLDTLYRFLARDVRLAGAVGYMQVWLAGSGITTAWGSDREAGGAPGDLDTLLGVDYAVFRARNPAWAGSPDDVIATELNRRMQDRLWPATARQGINGSRYELTYYVNPGVGAGRDDIVAINPYAAYNLSDDHWSVTPVRVPAGFSDADFSDRAREVVAHDNARAHSIAQRFEDVKARIGAEHDIARLRNLAVEAHEVVRQGAAWFDEIHDGRHAAFAPGGRGFFDDANYRWQAGKASGSVPYLRTIKDIDRAAHRDAAVPEDSAEHLLLVAALVNGGR